MTKDHQRDRVYAAEQSIDQGAAFQCADQVRSYVAAVTAGEWWQSHGWPDVRVHVGRGRRANGGRLSSGTWFVSLPGWGSVADERAMQRAWFAGFPIPDVSWPWAWRELIVCHELTHVGHMADTEDRRQEAGHGAAFAGRYLETVEAVLGPMRSWKLRRAFDRHAVGVADRAAVDLEPCGFDALRASGWAPYRAKSPVIVTTR